MQTAIEVMGGTWKPGILFRLRGGPMRLPESPGQVPWISERVLIRQFRELEPAGIVARTEHGTRPPRVDHALNDHGRTLEPLLAELGRWGALHLAERKENPAPGRA